LTNAPWKKNLPKHLFAFTEPGESLHLIQKWVTGFQNAAFAMVTDRWRKARCNMSASGPVTAKRIIHLPLILFTHGILGEKMSFSLT